MHKKYIAYAKLMRLDKPIGSLLLLWPTLIALWIAGEGTPSPEIVIIFILGVFVMRSLGCIINDILDRNLDGRVLRTQNRPLVIGNVSVKEALMLFSVLLLFAFLLVIQLNFLTMLLSIAALFLACCYPLTKRYIYFPQAVLGLTFGCSIPMAFSGLTNTLPLEAFYLFFANFLWVLAYDTQYAMVDKEDDLKIGIKSTAILFGKYDCLIIFLLQMAMLLQFVYLGFTLNRGYCYYLGCFAAAICALYQQYLIKDREREDCFKAFLNNNYLGALLFMGVFLDYINVHLL